MKLNTEVQFSWSNPPWNDDDDDDDDDHNDDEDDDEDDALICRLLSLNQDPLLSLEGSTYFAARLQFNTLPPSPTRPYNLIIYIVLINLAII